MEQAHTEQGFEAPLNPDILTGRGIEASVGRHGAPDRVEAHKWFNIAALTGAGEAIRLRRELAQEMTADEIATAQRLAREWLKTHPVERPSVAA